jgi:ABC-2 type transport system ATP-binding protein
MEQLYSICDRLIWIADGRIVEDGIPKLVGMHYLDSMEDARIARLAKESEEKFDDQLRKSILELTDHVHPEARRDGSYEVSFTGVNLYNTLGEKTQNFDTGDGVILELEYTAKVPGLKINVNMDFVRDNWQYCYGSCCVKAGDPLIETKQTGKITFRIDRLMLLPGKYYLDVGINGADGELYDNVRNILQITVRDYTTDEFGPCTFEHHWHVE